MEIWAVVQPEKYNKFLWYKILYAYSSKKDADKKAEEMKVSNSKIFVGKLKVKKS